MKPARNDPCPCGSGKKYKKCCGLIAPSGLDPGLDPGVDPKIAMASAAHDADARLTEGILRFARTRMGRAWLSDAFETYTGNPDEEIGNAELQMAVPWLMYSTVTGDGVSLAMMFREERHSSLSTELRDLLDAQLRGWMSIWDVRRVERGVGVEVADLLSGEKRFVHEISGSKTLGVRDVVLGRVLELGGVSIFGGLHPQPLEPRDADLIVREIRRMNHVRTRPVAPEKLRLPEIDTALIDMWRDAVAERFARPAPQLSNTDGDPLLLTTDHFDLVGPDRAALVARLTSFAGAQEPETSSSDTDDTIVTITKSGNAQIKSWDNTIIGRVVVKANRMSVESNSTRRADALRAALEEHLGPLVRYRIREETPQEELMRRASDQHQSGFATPEPPPGAIAAMKVFKERYMLEWLDQEIPALGGLTPREAVKSPRSMKTLELLLRDMENHEGHLPENERFDVDRLRTALGINRV